MWAWPVWHVQGRLRLFSCWLGENSGTVISFTRLQAHRTIFALAYCPRTPACTAAGDKPELRWPEAAAELASLGYSSTLQYVEAAAAAVLRETGLVPHVNAGVMGEEELRR